MSTSYIQRRYITPVIAGPWYDIGYPIRFDYTYKYMVQTGKIPLSFHGIPNLNVNIYTNNDKSREFIKVPLDPNPTRHKDISLKDISLKGTPKKRKKYSKQTNAYTSSKKTKKRHINKHNRRNYKN